MTHIISSSDLVLNNDTKKWRLTFHKPLRCKVIRFTQFLYRTSATVHPQCVIVHSSIKTLQQQNHRILGSTTSSHSTAVLLLEETSTSGKYKLKNTQLIRVDENKAFDYLDFWFTDTAGTLLSTVTQNQVAQTTLLEQVDAIGSDLICFLDLAPSRVLNSQYAAQSEAGGEVNHVLSRVGNYGANSMLTYSLQYGSHALLANFAQTNR